jgi:hypothetical protein
MQQSLRTIFMNIVMQQQSLDIGMIMFFQRRSTLCLVKGCRGMRIGQIFFDFD